MHASRTLSQLKAQPRPFPWGQYGWIKTERFRLILRQRTASKPNLVLVRNGKRPSHIRRDHLGHSGRMLACEKVSCSRRDLNPCQKLERLLSLATRLREREDALGL